MMDPDYGMAALGTPTYSTTPMTSSQQQQTQQQSLSSSPVPLKRTRAKRSCDFCRQRKSKCDADISSPCTNCKAWGYTCEFQTVRKKRGPPSVYVDNLEKRCKKMESLLMQLTNTTIKDLEQNDFRPTHQRNISDPAVVSDSSSDDDDDDEGGGSYSPGQQQQQHDADDEGSIVNRLDRLDIHDYDSIKYTGQSAGLELLDQDLFKSKPYIAWPGRRDMVLQMMADDQLMVVRTEKSATTGKLDTRLDVGLSITSALPDSTMATATGAGATVTATNKPSKSLVDQMVKLYFTHLHISLPIINKARFLQLYQSQSTKLPKVLLHAMLAVAFRFAAHHSLLPTKTTATTTTLMEHHSDYYFRKVMKQLRDTARSRLCHVQAGLLATLYLDMDGDDVASIQWHTLGKAIRMAQDLGLHRSCDNWQLPPSEIETRHRVFYACYALDRWIGARAGKPLTILDRDFDTTLPSMYEISDTDDTGANKNKLPNTTSEQQQQQPKQPIYRAFVLWVKLSEILGRVLKALYAPSAKKSNSNANLDDPMILVVFDRRLKHWQSLLEETVDGTTLPLVQSVGLQIYYNTVLLLLRRPFLSLSKYLTLEQLVTESREISLKVASDIFHLVEQNSILLSATNDNTQYFGSSYLLPTCYIYAMFLSSLAHLAIVLQDRTNVEKRQALWSSIDLIQSHQRLCASRRALEILHMLVTLHEIQTIENHNNNNHGNDLKSIKLEKSYDDGFYLHNDSFYIPPGQQRDPASSLSDFHNNNHHLPPQQQHHQQQYQQHYMIPAPTIVESEMPKTHWFQRYVNTSVVGGVPTEIQHEVQSDLSQQQQQQQQQSHYPYTYPPVSAPAQGSATTPMTLHRSMHTNQHNNNNSNNGQPMFYSPYIPNLTSSSASASSSASPSMSCTVTTTTTPHYSSGGAELSTITATTTSSSNGTHDAQHTSLPYDHDHHHHHHHHSNTSDTLLLAPTSVLQHDTPTVVATAAATAATPSTLSPSNLNWHDWQYYVNQHHHQSTPHSFTTPSSSN
ncbi:fungal-specific transcription factor domain-domain-containing protein [Absidia repens]|uniref:Fungal-specific transcription factor domain-domain-containing protein n=1 Tax=Absidia repens TaxID=90262 RepID=A0A1X2I112_9FUNG|nr:fungal-specific transcription factor domain-domain-containing protein [Absidia repens]